MPGGQKSKTEARSSIVTKSNKDFKNGPHQKKKNLKSKTKQYLERDTETSQMAVGMSQELPSASSPLPALPSPGVTEKSQLKGAKDGGRGIKHQTVGRREIHQPEVWR